MVNWRIWIGVIWTVILTVGLVSENTFSQGKNLDNQQKPNILWIVSEDNSASYLGCYGNEQATTPNLDKLAKEGFLYTQAFSAAPVCAPTRSTMITGVYASSMGTQ